VHAALAACFELCVSYCGLLLNPDMAGMFPQPPAALARGSLQLFDEMATSPDGLPPGFLEEFAVRFETEGLPEMLAPVIAALPSMMQRVSPLGDFRRPMSTLCTLVAIKPIAAAVAAHPRWCPPHRANGRAFEDNSVLGPFFACAGLQDVYPPARPDVRETCFGDRRSTGDAEGAVNTLRTTVNQVQDGLYQAVYGMLRHGGDTREAVVRWLAAGVNANAGRSKIQHQPLACASHGGAANLSAVALRLAAPFADPGSRKFMKIDPNYVRSATCKLNLGEVTRVLAAADAVEAGMLPAAQEPAGWSFITECFFLTARALHLGYIKCIAEQTALPQQIQRRTHQLNDVEGMRASWASSVSAAGAGPPTPRQHQQFNNRVAELQMELVDSKDAFAAFEATLQDPRVLGETMQFYRLAATWLIWVATNGQDATGGSTLARAAAAAAAAAEEGAAAGAGAGAATGGAAAGTRGEAAGSSGGDGGDGGASSSGGGLLPLPCPPQFALLPEHLVDDIADFLLYICRFCQQGSRGPLQHERLDEFMSLFVLLLGCPEYVKNPYLRAKFVEVLRHWLPGDPDTPGSRYSPQMANLFEGHPLALTHLVPAALRLYVDIEAGGGANQFYDKFNIRYQIGEICEYLWKVEPHRRAWIQLARTDTAFYTRFLNMLINDAIWLLDESLNRLPEVRQFDTDSADADAWAARPAQERSERESANQSTVNELKNDLTLAKVHVRMMGYTSRNIAAPFLTPDMVGRVANMLNYFLKYLAGSKRRALKVKDPEKYGWDPKELLSMIVDVYLSLSAADVEGVFAAAIAADGRSYTDQLFTDTATVLRTLGLKTEHDVSRFEEMAERTRLLAAVAQEEEADLGDIPDEFADPIMCTLMLDPVLLPSGDNMDRPNIMRHLLTDETNPFTRQPLKIADLVTNTALKARIDAWVVQRRALAAGGGDEGGVADMEP
jgi:ubiquitin conjugation factor E4 B